MLNIIYIYILLLIFKLNIILFKYQNNNHLQQPPPFFGFFISSFLRATVWGFFLETTGSFLLPSFNCFPIDSNNSFRPKEFKAETILKVAFIELAKFSASSLLTCWKLYLSLLFPTIHTKTLLISIFSFTSLYKTFKAS